MLAKARQDAEVGRPDSAAPRPEVEPQRDEVAPRVPEDGERSATDGTDRTDISVRGEVDGQGRPAADLRAVELGALPVDLPLREPGQDLVEGDARLQARQ